MVAVGWPASWRQRPSEAEPYCDVHFQLQTERGVVTEWKVPAASTHVQALMSPAVLKAFEVLLARGWRQLEDVAGDLGLSEATVENYAVQAIQQGAGYTWSQLGVPDETFFAVLATALVQQGCDPAQSAASRRRPLACPRASDNEEGMPSAIAWVK